MIKEIALDNTIVKYQITYKDNKNTYFHFKKKGYIQVNASKYQTHKNIIKFMEKNSESFVRKFNKIDKIKSVNDGYYLLGIKYKKVINENSENLVLDQETNTIYEPRTNIEQLDVLYKDMEKAILLAKLEELKNKYLNNEYINIEDIHFKTRYMHTRFGSCNPVKKSININLYLVHYDEKYLEYVFLHEIAHLVHRNHSSSYYLLLSKLSSDYKQLKKELNNKFNER